MKWKLWLTAVILLGLSVSMAYCGEISVTGEAEIRVVPDEVILFIGIETWNKNLNEAKSANDEIVKKTMAIATRDFSLKQEKIQTDFISIEPRYESGYEKENFIGYFVRKSVVITLNDLAKFESLLTKLLDAGVTDVQGIDFRTTELRKHKDEARKLAVNAAKEKATALASELDQRIGPAQKIEENQTWWWGSYNAYWGYRYNSPMSQNVIQNAGNYAAGDETIAPGQIAVKASVTVTFELK